MGELLAGLVPGLPELAVRSIVTRADGVPLYAVETVRMLLADGQLSRRGDGTYAPSGDLTELAVPESLTALIAARLDGLEPTDRSLLQDAAVLGQSFTLAAIASVSSLDEAALEPRLRNLVRHELLTVEADPRSPERGQYAFVQALIREVAYNTLAKRNRKARHLAAARFFESLGTDELAAALAGHYLAAYRNAPEGPELDAVAIQARIGLTAAAERAAALGSHDQALRFYEQALEVTADPGATAELLEAAGEAASAAGQHDAAERHLRAAVGTQRGLGDRIAAARATAALGRALVSAYRTPDALALLEPAAEEFADLAADPAVIALGGQLARAYFVNNDLRQAITVADPVLEAAEHADLVAVVADTLVTKGTALALLGRASEGLGAIPAGQDLAEAGGLGSTLLRAYGNRASIENARDPRAGLDAARAGLQVARRLGRRAEATVLLANGTADALRTGDWSWALAELVTALADELEASDEAILLEGAIVVRALCGEPTADDMDKLTQLVGHSTDPNTLTSVQNASAFTSFAAGRLAEARAAWQRVAELSPESLPAALPRAAPAALWAGDATRARDDLAALDVAGVHGPAVEADRTTIRAGLAVFESRSAEGLRFYRVALTAWRELGLAWDEALCELDMTTLLPPSDPEVGAAADAVREILTRLEARPFLEKLPPAIMAPVGQAGSAVAGASLIGAPGV